MENKVYHCLTSAELEKKVYKNWWTVTEWSFIAHVEGSNYCYYAYDDIKKKWVDVAIQDGNLYKISILDILTQLVNNDLLPEGNFLIDGSW